MSPFPPELLRSLAHRYGTPLWVYDATTIRRRISELRAFDTIRYAQKANSNLNILRLMRSEGVSVDAVSRGEIERSLSAGYAAPDIVFTADLIDSATLEKVKALTIPVNAGSIEMLHQLGAVAPGHPVWLRINPGFGHGHSSKTNTGGEHSKHGIWHTELSAALDVVRAHGLGLVGLHMHIGSGADYEHLQKVGDAMIDIVERVGPSVRAISAGGGLSIPSGEGEPRIDTARYYALWDAARKRIASRLGQSIHLEIEPGRYLVAESGVLVAEVRATKTVGSRFFALVDAGFNDLLRPSMYGSHHEISILECDAEPRPIRATVVAGPLCESGDVFTQDKDGVVLSRDIPQTRSGDLMVFHDTGAYGASMSSNYNSRPLAAEVLVDGGDQRLIRRRQTLSELFALETGL